MVLKKQLAQQSVPLGEPLSASGIEGWSPILFHLLLLLSPSLDSPVAIPDRPEVESAAATIADLQRRNAELEQKLCDVECQLSQFQYSQDASVGEVTDIAIADPLPAVDDLVLIRDAHGRCTEILTPQSRHLDLFPEGMLGKTLHETFSNEVANHLWNAMRRAVLTQTIVQTGFYLRQGDQAAWFDARISPLGRQAGLWVVRDATAYKQMEIDYRHTQVTVESLNHLNQQLEEWVRVQAEELAQTQSTLRLNEERLRLALVAAQMGVWSMNLRTGEEVWSAESEALFGFAPGEFDGTYASFVGCIHPDDRALVEQQIDQARITGDYRVDYRVVWPDQTVRWIATRGQVRYDDQNQPISLNGIDLDITDRQRQVMASQAAAAALKQSEEQFRQMFESAPLAIGLIDVKTHRLLRSNAAHSEMTGFSREELQQMSLADLSHPDDLAADVECMQQLVDGTISRYQLDKRLYRKNGECLYGLLTATLLRDAEDQPLYCLGMVEDITDRKQAEHQLHASLREKDVLLKEIHHRVKNNLQIISSLLRMQSRQVEDAHTRSLLQDSQNRVQSMALIHEQLYQSPDLSQIDFKQYLEPLVSHLFRAYGVSRREIHVEIRTHRISLTVDYAIPCGLIINELISNALKYAFPARACGTVPVDDPRIEIELQAIAAEADRGSQWALTVQDNGIGLDPSFQWEHLNSLGLRIVRNLADQLNGTIQLLPISGTCFHLLFPRE